MHQFFWQHGSTNELDAFPYIVELGVRKNQTIQLDSLPKQRSNTFRFYHIIEGKFEWNINGVQQLLFPGDNALILPDQLFGGEKDFLDIGSIGWIQIKPERFEKTGKLILGEWSHLSIQESNAIGKVLALGNKPVLGKMEESANLIQTIAREISNQEIGFQSRVAQLIDNMLILSARQFTRQQDAFRNFPKSFMKLEQDLRSNLSHQWTVSEMAAMVGLGTTAFTEKVKNFTGFSPLNYLINIRISEAIKLLKRQDVNLTDIALDTGFYSSQHFSTTFKKLTGYTPGQFRKNMS